MNAKIRTIIVDDERPARTRLRRLMAAHPEFEIVAECEDGPGAVEMIRSNPPELVLLDINMPRMDGFDVLDSLGPDAQPPVVIFVTAYDKHAVRAFEACALDYLLKPTSPERLARALSRARDLLFASREQPSPADLEPKRFVVRCNGRVSFVAPDEIDWVEAAGNYAILHVGLRGHMLRETMSGMEEALDPRMFARVNRSAILNLRRVKNLRVRQDGLAIAVLHDDQHLRVTKSLRTIQALLSALKSPE